jgi:D-xylose 1-dehydrogenase (NADP+, D-xylono-1,5-lactone-forming)
MAFAFDKSGPCLRWKGTRMTPLRIGILGAANIARQFVAGVRGSEKVVVAAVASRRQQTAETFAREFGIAKAVSPYEALLADPEIDAVYNPLPNGLHAEWSIRAAEAGKYVLCEKPLGPRAEDVRAMFAAADKNGVRLVEAYPYLSQPQTLQLRELVASGAIGRVRMLYASFGFTLDRPGDIRWDAGLGGGALLDVGCYTVSLARVITGARPGRVSAAPDWAESGVDRSMVATLEHEGGALAQICASFAAVHNRFAVIVGESGVIETNFWNHTSADFPPTLRLRKGHAPNAPFEIVQAAQVNGFRAEAESFADHVAGGVWNGASAQESLDIAETLDAILASARSGAGVNL